MFLNRLNSTAVAAAAKLPHSCLTLWDPMDGSPPSSAVPGILQARTQLGQNYRYICFWIDWTAQPDTIWVKEARKKKKEGLQEANYFILYVCLVTQWCPTLFNHMDCSLQGSSVHGDSPGKKPGVGCHVLPPGNLPNPGIELRSPAL